MRDRSLPLTSGGIITNDPSVSTEIAARRGEVALPLGARYYFAHHRRFSIFASENTMAKNKTRRAKTKNLHSAEAGALKLRNDQALLMVTASEGDANMLYAVGFFVPDPFIFFQHKNVKLVVMSDLEIDRAKKQAHVDRVLSLSAYQRKLRKLGKAPATMSDLLDLLLRERGIRSVIVPANFSALLADQLRAKGFSVQIKRDP